MEGRGEADRFLCKRRTRNTNNHVGLLACRRHNRYRCEPLCAQSWRQFICPAALHAHLRHARAYCLPLSYQQRIVGPYATWHQRDNIQPFVTWRLSFLRGCRAEWHYDTGEMLYGDYPRTVVSDTAGIPYIYINSSRSVLGISDDTPTQGAATPENAGTYPCRRNGRRQVTLLHEHITRDTHAYDAHRHAVAVAHQTRRRPPQT